MGRFNGDLDDVVFDEDLNDDDRWKDDVELAFDPDQPRDEEGQWTSGGGGHPGDSVDENRVSEDALDSAGDDLLDLMREFHNTNSSTAKEYIVDFARGTAAQKLALKEELDSRVKFDSDGMTTLYRGSKGNIKEERIHRSKCITALPWEGEVLVRVGDSVKSFSTDKKWAERFAKYDDFASKIAKDE